MCVMVHGQKLVVKTFFDWFQLLDRAQFVKQFIADFNNSVYFLMKCSKKEVVEIFINYSHKFRSQWKFRQIF